MGQILPFVIWLNRNMGKKVTRIINMELEPERRLKG